MEAKEQLTRLYRIQQVAVQTRQAQEVVESAPRRIEEIEARFRDRNAEYVAVKDRYDELEKDQRTRNTELEDLEERRKKFMDDLMGVKNQREYAAMLKEIDAVKAMISDHEDAVIRDMEEIEKLTGELKTHEEHIIAERELVGKERTEVEADEARARKAIEELAAERREFESGLPRSVSAAIERLELRRQGVFLSKAENGTCLACFVRVRPQVFQEIKLARKVHSCSNCRRFLYYEPSIQPKQDASGAGEDAGDGVEAVNGGAV